MGRAIAEAFAAEGARLALTATDTAHLRATASACAAVGATPLLYGLELADPDEPARVGVEAVAELGGLDVLVNNAGLLGERGALADSRPDVFDRVVAVTVGGTLRLVQAVLPAMGHGSAIVNVTSGAAGRPGWGAYGVSRLALNGMTSMLRDELADRGIRVVAVNPGPARTAMRAAAYPKEDPATVPHPAALVEPFVAIAAGADPGAGVVEASQWRG